MKCDVDLATRGRVLYSGLGTTGSGLQHTHRCINHESIPDEYHSVCGDRRANKAGWPGALSCVDVAAAGRSAARRVDATPFAKTQWRRRHSCTSACGAPPRPVRSSTRPSSSNSNLARSCGSKVRRVPASRRCATPSPIWRSACQALRWMPCGMNPSRARSALASCSEGRAHRRPQFGRKHCALAARVRR